jgi:hypothetical protein
MTDVLPRRGEQATLGGCCKKDTMGFVFQYISYTEDI